MKTFLSAFAICYILCTCFLFFGGTLILQSIWGLVAIFSLIIAVSISLLMEQETKMEKLEQRLQALEASVLAHGAAKNDQTEGEL